MGNVPFSGNAPEMLDDRSLCIAFDPSSQQKFIRGEGIIVKKKNWTLSENFMQCSWN